MLRHQRAFRDAYVGNTLEVLPDVIPDNPLVTREDLSEAVRALWEPVCRRLPHGTARARLGSTGAHYCDAVAGLEGFARPLWGLVPLAAGGGGLDWTPILRGLAAGTDPEHDEFWGFPPGPGPDQRLVEMAAIGFGLALIPQQLWEPLDRRERANLARWLGRINGVAVCDNNWLFFRVLVNEGLATVGAAEADLPAQAAALDRLESFYLGDGWYSDGQAAPRRDYYVPWGMHWYGLVYARLAGDRDPQRAQRLRERAALFAQDFAEWFAEDGAALPFGRSLTYRFAQGAFWGALAFAGESAQGWGEIKGLALRHLRWWTTRPATDHAGLLTIGYGYPNLIMSEAYNSPGSPYWAMKFFLPLALAPDHPFWSASEVPPSPRASVTVMPHASMVVSRDQATGHVAALAGGQHCDPIRHGAAKYSKFAYSTAFGFSVPSGLWGLDNVAADSMLALSDDGAHWRVRGQPLEARIEGGVLYSRWSPMPGVEVETWLLPRGLWHVRMHRLRTERPLWSAEGGWALDRTGDDPAAPRGGGRSGAGGVYALYPAGGSGVRDLSGHRTGELVRVAPNTNVLYPRTVLPTLRDRHEPGEHRLVCAVLGTTDRPAFEEAWAVPPALHEIEVALPEAVLCNRLDEGDHL